MPLAWMWPARLSGVKEPIEDVSQGSAVAPQLDVPGAGTMSSKGASTLTIPYHLEVVLVLSRPCDDAALQG